jgi:AcrR family transcriptional regulator
MTLRRDDILQAAAQIFRQKGYNAASMQDIADAVGLQKASLYYHVSSKQEILLDLLNHALDLLITDMESILQADVPADEKLHAAMRAYVRRLTAEADLAAVLLLEYRSLEPKRRAKHIQRRSTELADHVVPIIRPADGG